MILNKWQCWLKGIYLSLATGWPFNFRVSGCDYVDIEEHENCKVSISKCECCGKVDISWSRRN